MLDLIPLIESLTKSDKKTLAEKGLKGAEEIGELADAILAYGNSAGSTHKFTTSKAILEECVDITLVVMSIAFQLGYSFSDFTEMMKSKALYWSELQNREGAITYPLPYEIHITVKTDDLGGFREICAALGVKPIVLDLQDHLGNSTMHDVMTSSVHLGNNGTAYHEVRRISTGMVKAGFNVVREKIETVPWHPAAPSRKHANPYMPKDCYFENHFGVRITEGDMDRLREIAKLGDCHLSRNIFKRHEGGTVTIMLTLRRYTGTYEDFKTSIEIVKDLLAENQFLTEKVITEFSIFDTKVSHDSAWLTTA